MKIFISIIIIILSSLEIYSQDKIITLEMKAGDSDTLKIPMDSEINWISGNQDIAVVDSKGIVHAVSPGTTSVMGIIKNIKQFYHFNIRVISDDSSEENIKPDPQTASTSICREKQIILDKILEKRGKEPTNSRIGVSENDRYLIINDSNEPFIFISQTLWAMTRRLKREEVVEVLDICVEQGFTAIQLIAHSHYMGRNRYEDLPFKNDNFLCPEITEGNDYTDEWQYDWWDHLEFIIQECIKRDLMVCLLPTWREQWNQKSNLNVNNAYAYGKFIGSRYGYLNEWIIWIMGGDAAPDNKNKLTIQRDLAKGIAVGINNREYYDNLMMSYHTFGPSMTNTYFPENEEFMDFNTIQSGQGMNRYQGMITKSRNAQNKPTIDFEPFYDKNGELQNETRTTIISGIFSGGFGTSYGNWNIWHCGARNDIAKFNIPESFENSYGAQIKHLKKILTPRFLTYRVTNQDVLAGNYDETILANTSTDSSFIYIYSAKGKPFTVDLNYIRAAKIECKWFNPANGNIDNLDVIENDEGQKEFIPPSSGNLYSGNDWILMLEGK